MDTNIDIVTDIDVSRRRKWQPTPVFLPGESQGQRSLVGCHLWGHTESNTTEGLSSSSIDVSKRGKTILKFIASNKTV